jgi:DNA-binding LacI/PurR family transcriptional regulator
MGPHHNEVTAQRAEAAKRTVANAGGLFTISYGEYSSEFGATEATRMLSDDPSITAFIVGGDAIAVGVVGGLIEHGVSVPDDISVVSAGRARAGRWSSPALTTVDLRLEECARLALDHVARRHEGAADDSGAGVVLQPRLAAGGSVGSAGQ